MLHMPGGTTAQQAWSDMGLHNSNVITGVHAALRTPNAFHVVLTQSKVERILSQDGIRPRFYDPNLEAEDPTSYDYFKTNILPVYHDGDGVRCKPNTMLRCLMRTPQQPC